jgi:hypothetical protein
MRVVAVLCGCVVVRHINPSRAVRPCAPDAAPPRYPTCTGRKCRASRLLGPRGAIGVNVGERRWLSNGVRNPGRPYPLFYRRPPISPELKAQLENPKPCKIQVQSELSSQPLKRVTLWVYVYIDMGRVLVFAQ